MKNIVMLDVYDYILFSDKKGKEGNMLNVKDLQRELNIGRDSAYALMRAKAFPSIKIGRRYFVSEDAFARWLERYEGREFIV